jgi:fructose-bisphosphate aldolase class II
MIVTTAQLFKVAYGKFAIGAYNINNAEQTMGLFKGCIAAKAPFIIQLSKGARAYTDKRMLEAIIRSAEDIFPEAITKRVVDKAHAKGLSVEAELGKLGGVEEDIKVEEGHACLTNPEEVQQFVKESGCDSLAAAIGTSHGAYKFKGQQSLHFDVITAIQKKLPGFPIVMHGSSSVPKEEVLRINAAGGKLDPTACGVNEDEYLPAAKLGVTKVNIDTDGRLVWTRVHREFFRDKPAEFDFRPPGKIFIEEYAKFIEHKSVKLGSAGTLDEVRAAVGKK